MPKPKLSGLNSPASRYAMRPMKEADRAHSKSLKAEVQARARAEEEEANEARRAGASKSRARKKAGRTLKARKKSDERRVNQSVSKLSKLRMRGNPVRSK
jgi:hypothetical protein